MPVLRVQVAFGGGGPLQRQRERQAVAAVLPRPEIGGPTNQRCLERNIQSSNLVQERVRCEHLQHAGSVLLV